MGAAKSKGKTEILPPEDRSKLVAYAAHWDVVYISELPWRGLTEEARLDILEDLLKHMTNDVCKTHFVPLRHAMKQADMSQEKFLVVGSEQIFGSLHPVFREAVPYLALYYSRVSGQFSPEHFLENYAAANRF